MLRFSEDVPRGRVGEGFPMAGAREAPLVDVGTTPGSVLGAVLLCLL